MVPSRSYVGCGQITPGRFTGWRSGEIVGGSLRMRHDGP